MYLILRIPWHNAQSASQLALVHEARIAWGDKAPPTRIALSLVFITRKVYVRHLRLAEQDRPINP